MISFLSAWQKGEKLITGGIWTLSTCMNKQWPIQWDIALTDTVSLARFSTRFGPTLDTCLYHHYTKKIAILCAGAPDKVPFMADESVDSVPGLGKIAYNLTYYLKFAAKVIDKAAQLKKTDSKVNSPHLVELALWADMMTDKFNLPRPSSSSSSSTAALTPAAVAGNKRKADDTPAVVPSKSKSKETKDAKEKDDSTTNKRARSTRSSNRR